MRKRHSVIAALLALPYSLVWAQVPDETDLGIGIFVAYEDNPRQTETPSKEEFIGGVNSNLNLNWARRYYKMALGYQVEYAHYFDKTFDDKSTAQGNGTILLGAASSPLKWLISNSQKQVLKGPSSSTRVTAQNTAQRSTTQTGPLLEFSFANTESIQARYLYGITEIEGSDNDIETWTSAVNWQHSFSQLLSSTLGVQRAETELSDFDGYSTQTDKISLGLSRAIKNGSISAKIGRSRSSAEISNGESNASNNNINLNIDQDFESNEVQFSIAKSLSGHNFKLQVLRSISDSTQGLEAEFDNLQFDIGGEEFRLQERTRADLRWSGPSFIPLTQYSFGFTQSQSKDINSESSDNAGRVSFNLNRQLSTRSRAGLTISHSEFQSEQENGNESNRRADEVQLSYKVTLTKTTNAECDLRYQESKGRLEFENTTVRCGLNAKIF